MYNRSLAFTGAGVVLGSTVLDQTVLIGATFWRVNRWGTREQVEGGPAPTRPLLQETQ